MSRPTLPAAFATLALAPHHPPPHPHPRPTPGHALPASARRERHAHRLHARQRPLEGRAGRRRCDPPDQLRRRRRPTPPSAPTGAGSPSPANTMATPTSTSCRPPAANLSASPGTRPPMSRRAGHPTATSSSSRGAKRRPPGSGSSTRCHRRAGCRPPRPPPGLPGRHVRRRPPTSPTRRSATGDPEWRNYRGGQAQPIGIVSTDTWERTTPPWEGERQMDPVWMDGVVYYMSERDWAGNVWSFDPGTGTERQLTPPRRLRREVPRRGRRGGRLRAGRLPCTS